MPTPKKATAPAAKKTAAKKSSTPAAAKPAQSEFVVSSHEGHAKSVAASLLNRAKQVPSIAPTHESVEFKKLKESLGKPQHSVTSPLSGGNKLGGISQSSAFARQSTTTRTPARISIKPACRAAPAAVEQSAVEAIMEQTEPQPPAEPKLVIFVRDLLFSSKVVATARAEGIAFRAVRDVSKLLVTPGERLIVNFNAPEALDAAIAWKQKFGGAVTGFVAHVDADRIAAAKNAGIDRVMTNGGFTASLPQIIRGA